MSTYNIEVHDNLIAPDLHEKIYQYIKTLTFTGVWLEAKRVEFDYSLNSPKNPADWMLYQSMGRELQLHRCPLASDEHSLKAFPPIYLLWKEINRRLDNQFELAGNPEGMATPLKIPTPQDSNLKTGWRAYINAHYNTHAGHGGDGYAHRDTPLEYNDENTVTMLYIANPDWYPSWSGDLKFYGEDPEGLSKDHQQFNRGIQQRRNYNVGWLDQGRVVSPVPGRLIVYDGRCLHGTTLPSSPLETPIIKIAFRARRK
jgi:hypothetical protein